MFINIICYYQSLGGVARPVFINEHINLWAGLGGGGWGGVGVGVGGGGGLGC